MSLAAITAPRVTLDKTPCINIGKAEDQPCNVTDDNLKTDCYESMHAFKKIRTSTSGLRKSPNKWTKEENQKLAALVAHYGEKKWKRISAEMGGQKTGAQCAQHWKRVLSPEIRKGHWDENEEDLLLRLVVQYGSCWKKIAKKIPQRTDIQCRYQYLKAKQSREVKWDPKEDESLIKKVMEMANCTFFKFVNDGNSCTAINSYDPPSSSTATNGYASSLAGSTNSPMSLSNVMNNNKENENDNLTRSFRLNSSVNSDLSDDRSSLRSSGGSSSSGSGSGSETDTKDTDVSMSDSTSDLRASSGMEKDGASCHPAPTTSTTFNNSLGIAMHKVVWLDIAEHMARMKLTSTLRTALECKTRFLELVGSISVSGSPTNGQDSKPFDLKSSGGINAPSESRNAASHSTSSPTFHHRTSGGTSPNDTNINININNASDHNNNHISITNFSRNITINITNSPTNSTRSPHNTSNSTNNAYNPRPHSSPSHPHNPNNINGTIVKTESTSSNMETSPTTNTRTSTSTSTSTSTTTAATTSAATSTNSSTNNNNMPNAPSFPSFPPHFSPVAQPLAATAKPARSNSTNSTNSNSNSNNGNNSNSNNNGNGMMNMNGLDSLAAVASILPRELLADYAQF